MFGIAQHLVRRGNSPRLVNVDDDNDAECDDDGDDEDEGGLHVWDCSKHSQEGEFAQVSGLGCSELKIRNI